MRSIQILFVFLFILADLDKIHAQSGSLVLQENNLAKLYSKLSSFTQEEYDSIRVYSEKFGTEFTSLIKNNPATLNFPFKNLVDSNFCWVITSKDGNFRIYSWDTETGGTMRIYNSIYQWKSMGKVYAKVFKYEEGDAGPFCSKIFTVDLNSKTYYLAVTNGVFSTKDAMQSISAYSINGNKLDDSVKIFKTKTKILNSINVEFDFSSVVDRPERPLELIVYDDKQKILYIPIVDNNEQVTNKYILYQAKGKYFEFIGIEKGLSK